MTLSTRLLGPAALAAALAITAFAAPAPATAAEPKIRVTVDLGDVIFRNGHPYYRHGGYGYNDRLIVERDRYGRPVYYRYAPRGGYYGSPPYGNAWGHQRNQQLRERRVCDSRGRCRVEYYDPRYDRRQQDRYDDRYYSRHDRRYDDRRHDDRRAWNRDHRD